MAAKTAITTYCPACDDRTVHNVVRIAGEIGRITKCRDHTDVKEGLDTGEYELAK